MTDANPGRFYQHATVFLLIALGFLISYIAFMQSADTNLDFGDDTSALALNEECTDIRFRGPGMGSIGVSAMSANDATDCAALYAAGSIFLASEAANIVAASMQFGDDEGVWPEDGECDDPRFEGEGAVYGSDDNMHDATDCRTLFYQGQISFMGDPQPMLLDGIDFGDDFGFYTGDGECDDVRFTGAGMADTGSFDIENISHDASDCMNLYSEDMIRLADEQVIEGVDFGDNTSNRANDGECDDPRFLGDGMADSLLEEDAMHDANDCRNLYLTDGIIYLGSAGEGNVILEEGSLEATDDEVEPGKYVDFYAFEGAMNQRAIFDLSSAEFDTYLYVISPGGEEFTNDDFNGDINRSLLSLNLQESGNYAVWVTSFSEGETGSYTLEIMSD